MRTRNHHIIAPSSQERIAPLLISLSDIYRYHPATDTSSHSAASVHAVDNPRRFQSISSDTAKRDPSLILPSPATDL